MGWFSRKSRSRLPADMTRRLELLGRFEYDVQGSGVDAGEIYPNCIEPFVGYMSEDGDGFIAELRNFAADDEGGFATYGASCLVVELAGMNVRTPDALALLDAAIEFKRVRRLPSGMLKGYEWERWLEANGPDSWPDGPAQPPL
ncbi:MAG: hypothetical protein QOH84_3629 [Kribbellaceae bacterium]|nr:hypothetical protein [Kribbellaceae bacterium]